jgi:hypothetical protein
MKIGEAIKSLFHRQPPTEEELEARAEAEARREQISQEKAARKAAADANWPGRP